jgi:kynurenine formamidase
MLIWFEDCEEPNGGMVRGAGYYYAQSMGLDEHTGTHVDFPLHVLPPG